MMDVTSNRKRRHSVEESLAKHREFAVGEASAKNILRGDHENFSQVENEENYDDESLEEDEEVVDSELSEENLSSDLEISSEDAQSSENLSCEEDSSEQLENEDEKEEEEEIEIIGELYEGNNSKQAIEEADRIGIVEMLSDLSLRCASDQNDKYGTARITLRIHFARDCLWSRHLIPSNEIMRFGVEDLEFCVWRLEYRLGQAVIQANRKWAKILSYHVPLICPPIPISLAEQLQRNYLQWTEKVVEILLTWLHCRDGYCLIQTEKELVETYLTLEKIFAENITEAEMNIQVEQGYDGENYRRQRKSLVSLQQHLEPLRDYIDELVEDAREHLPMDRRFRVNQICDIQTVQKLDAGDYGYSFFGTSMVAYRHGVAWEGLHVLNEGHLFAQDITLVYMGLQDHEEKHARYCKPEEISGGPYNFQRSNQKMFRLVFLSNPEAEMRSMYGFIQHACTLTQNASRDSGRFSLQYNKPEEFMVGIYDSENVRRTANNLTCLEETDHTDVRTNQTYHIYKGNLNDLLALLAFGHSNSQKHDLQASLIVKNPTQDTFFITYCRSSVIGYNFENNFLVVNSSISLIEALIRATIRKMINFNWRENHSARSILEIVNLVSGDQSR